MNPASEDRWHRLSSRLVYQSKYAVVHLDDVKLPNGTTIQYTRVDHPPFVVIVPTILDKIIMVYNYRYPVNEWCLELPAGHIDERETPQEAASRELREETGYTAKKLKMVGWYFPSSARSDQKSYIFMAKTVGNGVTNRDESELQKVTILSQKTVYQKLFKGEIKHAPSIIALVLSQPLLCPHGRSQIVF